LFQTSNAAVEIFKILNNLCQQNRTDPLGLCTDGGAAFDWMAMCCFYYSCDLSMSLRIPIQVQTSA